MAADINETRRKKLLAHLEKSGGTMGMAELHEWSSLKLLCAHQAFSQLMEGLTDDGLVRWDGTVFTLADAAPAPAPRKATTPSAPAAAKVAEPEHDHDHDHDHGHAHDEQDHPHDDGHDHDHDHDHDHGGPSKPHPKDTRYGDGSEVELPKEKPRRVAPPPPPPPPAAASPGLRGAVKGALRKLLGRG